MAKAKVRHASSGKKKMGRRTGRKRAKHTKVVYHSTKEIKVERALIENFIGLQKVMVSLSGKFDSLSSQISRLLNLFEISAKTLAKREASSGDLDARRVMEKLDNLSQQAGLIGKGLALIHEVGTEAERPIIPLSQKQGRIQQPQQTPSPMVSSPGISAMQPPRQKMTRELSELEKSQMEKQRKLGESTNAGTNF